MSLSKKMMLKNGVKPNNNAASQSLISGRSSGSTTVTCTTTTTSTKTTTDSTISIETSKNAWVKLPTNTNPKENHEQKDVDHNLHVCGYDQINGRCGCRCGHMCKKDCGNIKHCQALDKQNCACYGYRPCRNFVPYNCYKKNPVYYASVRVEKSWPVIPKGCKFGDKCSFKHSEICMQVVQKCLECQNGLPCPWTGL
jgi:hypothetical protein